MKVQFFITCLLDHLYPDIAEAVVAVLQRQGLDVQVPRNQTCCGQPAFNGGFLADARRMAEHFLDVFAETEGPIVCASGSCASMVIHHYPELFADDPEQLLRAQAIAGRMREFSQFLVEDMGLSYAGGRAGCYTYHPSCHLTRDLGVRGCAETLLDAIPNSQHRLLPEAEQCCGFGGLFAIKMPAMSASMMRRKLDNIAASGADTCVVCDVSCMMHMNGGLIQQGREPVVRHIAEVLVEELP